MMNAWWLVLIIPGSIYIGFLMGALLAASAEGLPTKDEHNAHLQREADEHTYDLISKGQGGAI